MSSVSSATTSTTATTTANSSATVTTTGTTTSTAINWDTLISAQVLAKQSRATKIETKITANEAKIAAYQDLQSKLAALSTSTSTLSNSIVNSLSSSVYGTKAATLTSTGSISASSAVSLSIAAGTPNGDHTLSITQVATAQKVIANSVADPTAALGITGSFSIGLSGGNSATISLTSGNSLQDLVDSINAQSDTSNVQASIIQVSSSQYQMVLTATKDNAAIAISGVSGTDVMQQLGVTDSSGQFTNVLQAAKPAIFTLDGIQLSRNSNDISDALSGVTFSLLQATPSGSTVNISIGADTSAIATALGNFVTAYNDFRSSVYAQQQLSSSGTAATDAVLFGDSTMRDIMTEVSQALNTSVGGLSIADLGISFDDTNNLVLDASTLNATLTNNLAGVIALLATKVTTSSSNLSVVNTSTSPPASFSLDLVVDGSGTLTSASVGGDSSLFTISGNSIVGNSGTIYAGMAFTFRGTASQSITVSSTSGIAALTGTIAKSASDTSSGSLQILIENLQTQDTSMQSQADDILSAAASFQTELKARYAKYQAAIQTANSTLNYLTALLKANNS
jgi:flagellar hook-associated protein 2